MGDKGGKKDAKAMAKGQMPKVIKAADLDLSINDKGALANVPGNEFAFVNDNTYVERCLWCLTNNIAMYFCRPRFRISDVADIDSYGNKVFHKMELSSCCFPVRWSVNDASNKQVQYIFTKKGIPCCLCNCCCIDKYEINEATEKNKPGNLIGTAKCHFAFPNCGAKVFDKDNKEIGYWGSKWKVPPCLIFSLKTWCCGICINCCPSKHRLPYFSGEYKADQDKTDKRSVIEAPCCVKICPCIFYPWAVVQQTDDNTQNKYVALGGMVYAMSNICFPCISQVPNAKGEDKGHATIFGF